MTGDGAARDKAYRALNWATYMISASPQGQIIDGPASTPASGSPTATATTSGISCAAMGAVPDWAPHDQNHLTRSTSVVTAMTYSAGEITYTTADPDATETVNSPSRLSK